ncbi:LysE family translocator [Desmospora profundinema]|uniref:Threonine/homoserine/homoserine lactone efflux protein n=1 Tax=Desmospora profundinema TaxID=1571184 RepID=A0ABU1IHE0_9BACL|nr:LysE family translocator [Desmospora profundinema]MDR6224106.1 threonine/homoserine/homoserine lactone efflux protein [Desmospora profundinema]
MDGMMILSFIGLAVLLTLAPGPDILFVITQSIASSRQAGIAIALGLCSGLLVHTVFAAVGVSAILHQSATAFQAVKMAGAAYLLFLAWQSWRTSRQASLKEASSAAGQGFIALYRRGVWMNLLNPKVSLFFLAFLPQFITPGGAPVSLQMMVLGLLFLAQALAVFVMVAWLAQRLGAALFRNPGWAKPIERVKAGIYAWLGIRVALLEQ